MRSENKSEWGDDDEGRRENRHTNWYGAINYKKN